MGQVFSYTKFLTSSINKKIKETKKPPTRKPSFLSAILPVASHVCIKQVWLNLTGCPKHLTWRWNYVGDIKDAQEGITGVDILTGETLSPFDRVVSCVCVVLPVISGVHTRIVKKGFTKLDNVDDMFDASKGIIKTIDYACSSGVDLVSQANKTTTILGSYAEDMKNIIPKLEYPKTFDFGAKPGGFNILNLPNGFWKSGEQFWNDFNKEFIDKAVERGDNIILATPAIEDFLTNDQGLTGFGREIEYLTTQKGYHLSPDKTRLIKD